MFSVMVSVSHPRQPPHPRFSLVHVMSQFRSRVRVALARFHVLPPPRLVLVVWMVFLVLDPKPLCFDYERPLLTFGEQTEMGRMIVKNK